jgi:type II secretory ATPase GspE/PulE/Tfp pilus assembly ATPase PilB-like protein
MTWRQRKAKQPRQKEESAAQPPGGQPLPGAARPANDPTRSPFWRDSHPEHRFDCHTRLPREELDSPSAGISRARHTFYKIIDTGLKSRVITINLEPHSDTFRVRFHLKDGWHTVLEGSRDEYKKLRRELGDMVFGNPDGPEERRLPELGLFEIIYSDGDWKTAVCRWMPGTDGPIINIYFQPSVEKGFLLDLDNLGIRAGDVEKIKRAGDRLKGLIVASGPTGAGKSVLSYSILVRAQMQGRSVATIERPKKFLLPGARQVGLSRGDDYWKKIPEAVADDPDVLMVQDPMGQTDLAAVLGEAQHRLVITALHCNNAASTIVRFMQFHPRNIEKDEAVQRYFPNPRIIPEVLANHLLLTTGSRLLSRLCPHCKKGKPFEANFVKRAGIKAVEGLPLAHYFTTGCEACGQTGIAGIESVFEVIEVTPSMGGIIRDHHLLSTPPGKDVDWDYLYAAESLLAERAQAEGMRCMRHVGLDKVMEGRIFLNDLLTDVPEPYGPIGENTEEKS